MALASLLLALVMLGSVARAAPLQPIVFVPIDDRPVTVQLPLLLGRIAGRDVVAPPRTLLGTYLRFGQPDAIIAWLNARAPRSPDAYVLSSDMLAYGGLIASRVPGTTYADAYFRLNELKALRRAHPATWIGTFGTVMRLAPTGVPQIEDASSFFAAYPVWSYLQQYANLHDPPLPEEAAQAARLREQIGAPVLDAYLATRARNLAVDERLLAQTRDGTIDRLVLGQDDAGPIGLHVREVQALSAIVHDDALSDRVSIEPGADELGMALVAHAMARGIGWAPRIAVRYSTPQGGAFQDPLEFVPIATTIEHLIALCGGTHDDEHPEITLYVRVPRTPPELDDALVAAMRADLDAKRSVAFADLSFLVSYPSQGAFAQTLLRTGLASHLDAYSSWNTNANTVGTALAEAIAAGVGRRSGTYDALAHRTFTFMRFVDDVAFHVDVRPDLNAWLDTQHVDHTYVPTALIAQTEERNRAQLWPRALEILNQLYPGDHVAAMQITLPWRRTFETQIQVGLAPNIPQR